MIDGNQQSSKTATVQTKEQKFAGIALCYKKNGDH
jgi:hypothetical protein